MSAFRASALLRIRRLLSPLCVAALALTNASCAKQRSAAAAAAPAAPSFGFYTCEVVHTWPHDRGAFTQGLIFLDGGLLESTGLNGQSSLRKVDLPTGAVRERVSVPAEFFAEGMTVLGPKIYQLTWQNQKGFIYDLATLQRTGEFAYTGEGWGLTTDGRELILSDGTHQIRFLDPATFKVTRTISVFYQGQPVRALNELEYVKGEILANIWQTSTIARIDPADGRLLGLIDCAGLLTPSDITANTDVLNGIAYDATGDRLFVTGKNWPKLFEVRLKPKPASAP